MPISIFLAAMVCSPIPYCTKVYFVFTLLIKKLENVDYPGIEEIGAIERTAAMLWQQLCYTGDTVNATVFYEIREKL